MDRGRGAARKRPRIEVQELCKSGDAIVTTLGKKGNTYVPFDDKCNVIVSGKFTVDSDGNTRWLSGSDDPAINQETLYLEDSRSLSRASSLEASCTTAGPSLQPTSPRSPSSRTTTRRPDGIEDARNGMIPEAIDYLDKIKAMRDCMALFTRDTKRYINDKIRNIHKS